MSTTLETIRAEIKKRGWNAARLSREPGISYRAAWTIMHGDSQKIAWETLDSVLRALDLRVGGIKS